MLTLLSPAKINLFLRILHRRPDGYHELASLFQAIDLFDTLQLELSDADRLTCNDPNIPTDGSNLILKAADLFRKKTGHSVYLQAHLDKVIPYQAGLGGGSGNAATTLWGLNELCGRPATQEQLLAWGAEIGADVAFFLSQGTAYCTGKGEILRQLPPLPISLREQPLWIIKPSQGLSTPEVYRKLNVAELAPRDPLVALKECLMGVPTYFNDLEHPVFAAMPRLLEMRKIILSSSFESVVLCGSGSALFCTGGHQLPAFDDVTAYQVHFLNRQSDQWYQR